MSFPDYLKGLNPMQCEAALYTEGPLLILAGAGAGKTKTITYRILHLIKSGVAPEGILAITFTNKAAKEMRDRVTTLLTEDKELNVPLSFGLPGALGRPFVSTFHSLAVFILKESGSHIGVQRNFVIYDRGDSRQVIKDAIVSLNHDPKKIEPNKILSIISKEKGNFTSQEEYEAKNGDEYIGGIVAEVWKKYDAALAKEKALDFDDLLFKATHLLATHKDVREFYQRRWQYVHIDEYQDTNEVQYKLMQMIAANHKNIAVIGDGDQSIYGWRGADIRNILKFEEDYPEAKVVLLEENYRSTQNILAAANKVIEKNIYRKKKNLFTKNVEGEKITVYTAFDENDEANFIANTVREIIDHGVDHTKPASPDEIAVLFRANFQSRAIEEAFLRKNIPYTLLGTKFFERKEVKDTLSYLRASLNPDSLADIKRIINEPVRGIGKVTMLKIFEGKENELPPATLAKVKDFRRILAEIARAVTILKASEVVKFALTISGIEKSLKDEKDDERLENVEELVTLALKYDHLPFPEGTEKLLEDAALASDQDTLDDKKAQNKGPAVKLMTVHASKGLEFDHVFVSGLEQDLFPHSRSSEPNISPEQQEEERRLFYVAITRARKKLYLCHANVRTIFGSKQINAPSEFLEDIDDDLLDREDPATGVKSIFIDF